LSSPRRIAILCHTGSLASDLLRVFAKTDVDVLSPGAVPSSTRLGGMFDILMLDTAVDGALALCRRLRDERIPRVIFVAAPKDDVAWGIEALCAGAMGILYPHSPVEHILKAVAVVREDVVWAPRSLVAAALAHCVYAAPLKAHAHTIFDEHLSTREREVFYQAALGRGNRELARRLAISEATVKVHLTHIFQKLGLKNRAELAAAYHGILHRTEPDQTSVQRPA
jgi:DNA-binding NarL/FixJ family response regulator